MAGNKDKDTRILEMQFENRAFEKNIAKSQKSVEDFKKAMDLDKTSEGISKFSKALDMLSFSKLTDNIQKLTDKFTGLGTVSELILSQIRRGIEETAQKISHFISSMTTAQIYAGKDKYEMLNKSVQTIKAATGKDEAEVYSVLKRLNEYTDQTSYNFSDMAQNIGKFTSVGIDLADAEKQMEGIANWAARSGAGINEASRAMYNLSQAMGVGKLQLIDWKSIENAGMATKEFKEQLMEAAVAAGTLEKTVDKKTGNVVYKTAKSLGKQIEVTYKNVGSTLNKDWVTSGVLSSTLERYYYDDLYYENEEQQEALNKLLDQLISSGSKLDQKGWKEISDAGIATEDFKKRIISAAEAEGTLKQEVQKDGKVIYKTTEKAGKKISFTFEQLEESLDAEWFTADVAKVVKDMESLGKASYESAQKCLTFSDVIGAWKDQISTGWMKSLQYIFGELSESMEFFSNVCNRVGEALSEVIEFRNKVLEIWSGTGGRKTLIDIILGDYGKDTETGAYGILDLLAGLKNLVYNGLKDFLMIFMDPVDLIELNRDPDYLKHWIAGMLNAITNRVEEFFKKIRDFFNEEIDVGGKSKSRLEVIHEIVQGIAGALAFAWMIFKEVLAFMGEIGKQLLPSFDAIIGFLGELGISIYNTADNAEKSKKIKQFFMDLAEIIRPVTSGINTVVDSILKLLRVILGMEDGTTEFSGTLHSIGEVIKTVADIAAKVVGPILNFISKIIDAVSKLFKNGVNKESLSGFASDLGEAFKGVITELADNLPDNFNFIKDWIHNLFGTGKDAVKEETNNLFGLIGGVVNKADDQNKDINNKAQQNANQGPGLMGLLTGQNIAVWTGIAALASIVLLIRKATKVVKKIGYFFGELGETLRYGIKIRYKDETAANKFKKIATSIALIAASIVALGLIPLPNLIQGVAAVGIIMGALFLMFKLLQKSTKAGNPAKMIALAGQLAAMAASMVLIGIAVGVIALALIPFAMMNWDQYARAMAGLGGVLLQLVGFMALMKLLKLDGNIKMAGFAAFAFGLGILVRGIVPFASMNWDQYGRAMAGLGGVLLQILAFMEIFKILGLSTKALNFNGIVAFTFALALLVFGIKPFANMSWEQYGRVMAGLGGVLVEILAFMELFKILGLSTLALDFKGIIRFTLALAILVFAIKPFANMSWDQYARVMAGLGGVLLEMLAFMELFKILGLSTLAMNFKGIIKFTVALAILVFAIKPFANMSWDQYARVMAGLGGVLLEILAFMELFKILGLSTLALNFKGILIFAIGLKLIIDAIQPFAKMNWEQYARAMAGLAGVLVMIIGFMALLKVVTKNTDKQLTLNIAGLMGFAYGISALVSALVPFAQMDWEGYAKAMAGLAGILAIMLGFMVLLKKVKPDLGNMLKMSIYIGLFAAVVGIFAVALSLVKDMDWSVIAAFAAGLAALLMAVAGAGALAKAAGIKGMLILSIGLAAILGVISLMAPILIGSVMGALRNAAGDLAIIADLLGTFSGKMNGVNESGMDRAGRVFDKVLALIGKLVGVAFGSGNAREFMNGVSRLTLAADELIKFSNKMKLLPADGNTEKAIRIIDNYKDLFTNHLAGFGAYTGYAESFYGAMFVLGSGFDYFDSMTANVTPAEDNNGFKMIKELAGCAPYLDTIYKMDLDRFKTQLAELGGAMIVYAQGAASVSGEEITEDTNVGGAVTLLRKISESLTENGGFSIPENMPTDTALTEFGVQLAALAGALVAFEQAGAGLGDGTKEALKTLTFFKDLKTELLSQQSFGADLSASINSFMDGNGQMIQKDTLTQFGESIAQLGSAMAHFASSTQVVDKETNEMKPIDYTMATDALKSIGELINQLPSTGGLAEVVRGRKKGLYDLAGELNLLGDALGEFHTSTSIFDEANKTVTPMDFTNTIAFQNSVGNLQEKLPTVRTFSLASLFENPQMTLGDLGSQLAQLGSGINLFSAAVTGKDGESEKFDSTSANEAISVIDDGIVPLMSSLSTALPKIGGVAQIWNTFWSGRTTTLKDIGDAMGELSSGLSTFGTNINGKFTDADSIRNAIDATTSIIDLITVMANAKNQMYAGEVWEYAEGLNKFLDAFMNGFRNGDEYEASYAAVNKIVELMGYLSHAVTLENGIDTNALHQFNLMTQAIGNLAAVNITESKDFEHIGTSIATGVAAGIRNGTSIVTEAAIAMAKKTYEETMKELDANSPSKVFMAVGSYVGLGMAKGIESTDGQVADAATGLTGGVIETANTLVQLISQLFDENGDLNPTISPVLDMTNLDKGMEKFDSTLHGRSVGIDASVSASKASRLGYSEYEGVQARGTDLTGVYERMNVLGTQILKLGEDIRHMKLVLNTGVVAGGVTDDVDKNLGHQMLYSERNN